MTIAGESSTSASRVWGDGRTVGAPGAVMGRTKACDPHGASRCSVTRSRRGKGCRFISLLYKLMPTGVNAPIRPWRYIGPQSGGEVRFGFTASWDARLFFQINDDRPGNGNGQFDCSVTVRRT